jgi:hypothetical protein
MEGSMNEVNIKLSLDEAEQIARKKAEKQMGDNYFSNNKEVTNEVGRFN